MTDWRKDFWKAGETDGERAERVEDAREQAFTLFKQATAPQIAAWRSSHRYANEVYPNTAHGYWLKKQADDKYRAEVAEAAALHDRTAECVMVTGEVSEALSLEWDALIARQIVAEVAA